MPVCGVGFTVSLFIRPLAFAGASKREAFPWEASGDCQCAGSPYRHRRALFGIGYGDALGLSNIGTPC
jgi:hypothetical protein